MGDDPRHERQDALDLGPGECARAHAALAPEPAATRSSQATTSARMLGRLEHLRVLEEAEHEAAERGAVRDRHLDDRAAVVVRSCGSSVFVDGRVGADFGEQRVEVVGVDPQPDGDRRVVAEEPRARLDVIVGPEAVRRLERVVRAELDVAFDAVGPERAHGVAVAVEADEVPVAALRRRGPTARRCALDRGA